MPGPRKLPRRRARPGLSGAVPLACAFVLSALPAGAQSVETPVLRLVVTALDGVVGPGSAHPESDVDLRVAIDNRGTVDLDNVRIVVEVHTRARSRGLLRASLDRDIQASGAVLVRDVSVREGGSIAAGDIAGARITLDGQAAGWTGSSGVHPVAVSVVRGTEVLDRVVTGVVHLAAPPTNPLDALAVWQVDDPPWRLAVNEYPPDIDEAARPGGRLDRLVRALEQVPEAGVAIVPGTHLLEDLVDRADGFVVIDGADNPRRAPESAAATRANRLLQRIRTAVLDRPVAPIATPYARVDLGRLAAADDVLADVASDAVATGMDRLADLLGRAADPTTSLASQRIGDAGLALMSNPIVVVSWNAIVGPDLSLDADLASPVREVTTEAGRRVTLLVGDPYIEQMLAAPDVAAGSLVAAQRVIVESAMAHFEAPGVTDRPLVVLTPPDVDLPDDLGSQLLRGLATAPWLNLTGPDAVRDGADEAPAELLEVAHDRLFPPDLEEAFRSTTELVDGLDRTLVRDGTGPSEPARLRDDLARAGSAWLGGDVAARRRAVARVRSAATSALGTIEVAAAAGITLTAEEGTIPITLRRPDGAPLDVRVTVDALGRLGWPGGNTSEPLRLEAAAPQTVAFTTVARSRGTFPVVVRVTDPSGTSVLHEATISVRSTAISEPAVLALAVIVVLLVIAGLVRRRPREPRLRIVQDLPTGDGPDQH